MAQHRSSLAKLSLPPPYAFARQPSNSKYRYYPLFTPTPKSSAVFSPTTTPSNRPRAPEGPVWLFTLLQLIPLYAMHRWLTTSTTRVPLTFFSFLVLLGSALFLNIIYGSWKGRTILPSQWGLLAVNAAIFAVSCLLRFEGLKHCGPLETIFAEFAGALATKVFLDPSNKRTGIERKVRGMASILIGVFLLSQGWSRAFCSPLAIDIGYRSRSRIINKPRDCVNTWIILIPTLGGILSALQRLIGARPSLKTIGRKRAQVISNAMGAFFLCPFAVFQALVLENIYWQLSSIMWPLSIAVAFGMVISFFSDFYSEEKLLRPLHSWKSFQILSCCICMVELLFGLDISLVGFLFCDLVFMIGIQGLSSLPGQLSWDSLGEMNDSSLVYASWVKWPVMHIMSDKKSRKIAIFLLINTGFMVVEFFYGFISNSLGLISDACHMLFDCAALAIGLYASYISRLSANSRFNYGYGRFEVVSGFANAVLLVLVASLIVLESIERMLEPPEISTESLLLVSVGGLVVNIIGLIFFHEEHHHAHGGIETCLHAHSSSKIDSMDKGNLTVGSSKGDDDIVLLAASDDSEQDSQSVVHEDCTNAYKCHDHNHLQHDNSSPQHVHVHDCVGNHGHMHKDDHSSHSCDHHNRDGYHDIHDNDNSSHDHGHQHSHHHNHSSHSQDHQCSADHDHQHIHDHDHSSHDHDYNCSEHDGYHHHNQHHHHDHDHCYTHNHSQHQDHEHDHHFLLQHHDHSHTDNHSQHHQHQHQHQHQHHHMDHNMYGIFLHVLADTLGSVGVVISTLLIKFKGWLITDPACSIFLSSLIIASVIPLLRNSAEILLQRVPRHNETKIKTALEHLSRVSGVRNIQQVHIWSHTNKSTIGSVCLQISAGSNKRNIQEIASTILQDAGAGDLTLQIEEC